MSKVIKATHLVLTFPRLIERSGRLQNYLNGESAEFGCGETDAEEIIAETEKMVEDLLDEARVKAEEIIAEARKKAETILAEARKEVEQIRDQAEKEGYRTGYQEAQKALAAERKKLQEEIETQRKALEEEYRHRMAQLEPEVVQLAISIARKVINAELSIAPEKIKGIVRMALERAGDSSEVTLKVRPEDYSYLLEFLQEEKNGKKIKLEADAALASKGCLMETDYGMVDATVEGQLEAVASELLEVEQNG
ncbi:MAG: Flagellar assembly protein FliH [Thermoanaerobacterales bacterium 50_218]|nr:MAG: Flagellar assembly protein FliH [Thermoanaerobacterales bacterium 50_218]HAA90238.1 hypothetical protein [Peptococcaceae bacterium]